MSFAYVFCAQPFFAAGQIVKVEVDITKGLYQFTIVGMASKSVDEARDRVSSAIKNSSFQAMKSRHEKITVSLSPAEIKKSGAFYDLAIAIAYVSALGEIDLNSENKLFIGELSLDGKVLGVSGILTMVMYAKEKGFTEFYIPKDNLAEAKLIHDISIYPIDSLLELVYHIKNVKNITPVVSSYNELESQNFLGDAPLQVQNDISEIKGQDFAKRGLLIAATGRHHVCLYGPPGTGKTMLARAFHSILPNLSHKEMIEVNSIHGSTGVKNESLITKRPFRNPHHSASYSAIVGGGAQVRPGEISLAHHGVLFLDEFPEFDRRVIESLRQPLEDKTITISRADASVHFPSDFILVATMNPCPCGYYGSSSKHCVCTSYQIQQYRKKISGPIADRIDIWIHVNHVSYHDLQKSSYERNNRTGSISKEFLERVISAHTFQKQREDTLALEKNDTSREKEQKSKTKIILSKELENFVSQLAERLQLSPRSYYKLLSVARTIADLECSESILEKHILEAVQYRRQEQ